MQYDLLHFKEFAAFINCELDETGFNCGAAYLATQLPAALPLFTRDSQRVCVVEIPEDYRKSQGPETITSANDRLRFTIKQESS